MYEYRLTDTFYDVESLTNVFTVAWWMPKANAIILSYLDDSGFIQSASDEAYIRDYIYKLHPRLAQNKTQIVFENIGNTGQINEFDPTGRMNGILGMQSFAKRMGLANAKTWINARVDEREDEAGGLQYDKAYYPVKQTDPDYDPELHGYRFGYNSTNYDMSILAQLLGNLHDDLFRPSHINRPVIDSDTNAPLTAFSLREFNDELFSEEWKGSMAMRLANDPLSPSDGFGDFKKPAWLLRKAWMTSGRYIDVARLNEKLQKVGLKRLLGYLGLQIMESAKLSHDSRIENLEQFADLLAYNIADVINLQKLFEHKNYQNSFKVRGSLLEIYPQTLYAQKQGFASNGREMPCDAGNYTNIRRDRLTRESTSAKFVEYALAPYKPIKDIEVVSFLYPSKMEAEKLGIPQSDILEDTKVFFETNVTSDPEDQAHKDFMEVYAFYDAIRGKNFNQSDAYKDHYMYQGYLPPGETPPVFHEPLSSSAYSKELMKKYNTNLFYHHKDADGNVYRSSCLANFSIGGIHGAEVNMPAYLSDQTDNWKERSIQEAVEAMYTDAIEAIKGPVRITLPDYLELTERVEKLIDKNGTIRVREFIKSGSTRTNASWKVIKDIELFKVESGTGKRKINPKYAYVSSGAAHHEDFTSYYPLLLSRLSVFINPSYHGFDEHGRPKDPYYEMFLTRLIKKKESKDKTKTAEERELADIEQDSRKLLINAASGAGDATFDNNIRVNNAVISMRIIGQLFAWRIGQAQALAGARVPSTNTDGLYTMDISAEENDRILEEIAKDMHIGIEPERLDRFVSKDSNNRLEVEGGRIVSAKGGTLNSWAGPQPTQNLDHASIIDHLLANYMASEKFDNPADVPFDRTYARKMLTTFVDDHVKDGKMVDALKHFQWIIASSGAKHRYYYARRTNLITGDVEIRNLQHYNRIFLLKDDGVTVKQEMFLATRAAIAKDKLNRALKDYQQGNINRSDIWSHHPESLAILKSNGLDMLKENNQHGSPYEYNNATVQKVKGMPANQHIGIFNNSILEISDATARQMLDMIDLEAYLDILESSFKSWSNVA